MSSMNSIGAGDMRQKIRIDMPSRTPDGLGGYSREWVKVATLFATVRPLTGNERNASDRIEAVGGFHVIIRHRRDIDETHTLVWGDRRHNIRWVKRRGPRDLYVEIETSLGVAL